MTHPQALKYPSCHRPSLAWPCNIKRSCSGVTRNISRVGDRRRVGKKEKEVELLALSLARCIPGCYSDRWTCARWSKVPVKVDPSALKLHFYPPKPPAWLWRELIPKRVFWVRGPRKRQEAPRPWRWVATIPQTKVALSFQSRLSWFKGRSQGLVLKQFSSMQSATSCMTQEMYFAHPKRSPLDTLWLFSFLLYFQGWDFGGFFGEAKSTEELRCFLQTTYQKGKGSEKTHRCPWEGRRGESARINSTTNAINSNLSSCLFFLSIFLNSFCKR